MGPAQEIFEQLKNGGYFNHPDLVPEPPKITEEEMNRCRETDDFRPILFEWYRFVGRLCILLATMQRNSPAFRQVESQDYYVLIGLLNRCARLMLANIALSHEGAFGETTAVIDRCIFESAVKIIWLVNTSDNERFRRLVADGLKTELEFKARIEAEITARGGTALVIEKRMLTSIEKYIASSGMTAGEIADAKRLPDLASMIEAIWQDRMFYLVGQKLGSHHVHGTWVSLRMHYLQEANNGELGPRDHDCPTHVNQFVLTSALVLSAVEAFVSYTINEADEKGLLLRAIEAVRKEIEAINVEIVGNDFELGEDV